MKWRSSNHKSTTKKKSSDAALRVLAMTDSQDTNEILAKEDWKQFLCSECKEMVQCGSGSGDENSVYFSDLEGRSVRFDEAKEEVDNYTVPATHRWPVGIVQPPASFKTKTIDVIFVDQDKHSCVYAIEVCASPPQKVHDLYAVQSLAKDPTTRGRRRRKRF